MVKGADVALAKISAFSTIKDKAIWKNGCQTLKFYVHE
jgi:hypothetical protein